jgi:TatD DNase family protein
MKAPLIDSHCHLDFPELRADLDGVLQRASEAGVVAVQTICTEIAKIEELLAITAQYKEVYTSIGQHPCHIESDKDIYSAQHIIDYCLAYPKIIGIGETGLDYHYPKYDRKLQMRSFRNHIQAAQEAERVLIVHTRDAEEDTLAALQEAKQKRDFKCVIHCFTGTAEFAEECLKIGCYISASGIVTFKNAIQLHKIFKNIPLDKLLLETDAPYLAPVPMRGRANEPSYVQYICQYLTSLRGEDYAMLAWATTQNFLRLFAPPGL